jgi:fructokinase
MSATAASPMTRAFDVVTLGELLIDMFPAELGKRLEEVSAFQPKPGGAPANVAVAAKRLGKRSAFIGKVGQDAFGQYLVNLLKQEGVETAGVRFDPQARTTMAFIAMPDENHPEFIFYRNPGADMLLNCAELDAEILKATHAFHFGSLSLIQEPSRSATMEAMAMAKSVGALISFDANYRPALWESPERAKEIFVMTIPHVDLLKINEAEAAMIVGKEPIDINEVSLAEAAKEILAIGGLSACVITLGPRGSYFQTAEGGALVSGFKVPTIDATGCGDAFVAGLLCQLVEEGRWRQHLSPTSLHQALVYANAVGALTSMKQGVIPALPTADQVDEFLHACRQL